MFPHRYFSAPGGSYFPNPYFPQAGQGEPPPPPVVQTGVNNRRKGVSRTHVIPS